MIGTIELFEKIKFKNYAITSSPPFLFLAGPPKAIFCLFAKCSNEVTLKYVVYKSF